MIECELTYHGRHARPGPVALVCATMVWLVSMACWAAPPAPVPTTPASPDRYDRAEGIEIRRTEYGIPHIEAAGWSGLGVGAGYAQAADNLCTLAELFTTLRGSRSLYADLASPPRTDSIIGRPASLDSDFFFKLIMTPTRIAAYRAAQRPELQQLVDGYARGYNRYVAAVEAGFVPSRHVACRTADWLQPIDGDDVYRRMIELSLAGGVTRFIGALVHAAPPGTRGAKAAESIGRSAASSEAFDVGGAAGIGSNALALSAQLTDDGRPLLFGNPHWFWSGPDRFYEAQLTIAGKIDVAGAMFLGVPVVVIGFNRYVAWTHTVSTARRFGLFRLTLADGDPTSYWLDGRREAMTSRIVSVDMRDASGAVHTVSRRFYQSRTGMLVNLSAFSGKLKWSDSAAFALDDANLANQHAFDNYVGWAQSRSLAELIAVQRRYAAVPWANTLAIGASEPRVWFADIGPVPGVPDSLAAQCGVTIDDGRWREVAARVPLLDGSRSACEWQSAADSVTPHTLGLAELPQRLSSHYVANMNDSYWLTDPAAPMTGLPAIVGPVGTAQSLRTRLGHEIVSDRLSGADGYPGRQFNRAILKARVLDSTSMSARLFKAPLLNAVCARRSATISHDPLTGAPLSAPRAVDLQTACVVLARWSDSAGVDASGANLWDAFWSRVDRLPPRALFRTQFDPRAPLATPAGLDTADPRVVEAFALTVAAAQDRGEAFDEPRGERLYLADGDSHVPLYGGCGAAGYFTVTCPSHDGVSVAEMGGGAHGNSYLQIVGFTARGVQADTLLSTSESDDPASPHYRDASRGYAQKRWLRFPFDQADILQHTEADSVVLGP